MDATELRHYLRDLISDNVKVGIEILKKYLFAVQSALP